MLLRTETELATAWRKKMSLREILFGEDAAKNTDNTVKEEETKMEENTKANENTENTEAGSDEEVTTDMLVGQIISKHPSAAQFLMDCGMECIFCPASQMESLGEACAVHGIDADEICAALNEKLAAYKE